MLGRRLAAVATVALAAVGVLTTSTAATAAGTKCVALVVDFSHVGGSVSSACVTAKTSATGSDVLVAGHHKVTFDPRYGDDFVCAIDGVPAAGCHATDNTHYWVYYHRAPGSSAWHVSQEGAGTYKPVNASTEGWVYDDGSSSAPTPRDVRYRSICTKPAPSPSPSPSPARSRTGSATASAAAGPVAAGPSSHSPSTHRTAKAVSAPAVPTASPSEPSPSVRATAAVAVTRAGHRMYRVPLGLIVGLVVAMGLGAAAIARLRRSSG